MKQTLAEYLVTMTPFEILIGFGALVISIMALLITIAFVLDKLNVKRLSIIPPSIELYQDGDSKISRVSGRKKTVRRRVKK